MRIPSTNLRPPREEEESCRSRARFYARQKLRRFIFDLEKFKVRQPVGRAY